MSKINTVTSAALVAILSGNALAQEAFFLPELYIATDISADGRAVTGNFLFDYETFLSIGNSAPLLLGAATTPVLGSGAGGPQISDDGTYISATILDSTSMFQTQGIWNRDTGWVRMITGPVAPNGANLDNSVASAWSLSGDGTTIGGFYWDDELPGMPGGVRAQASLCSVVDAPVALQLEPDRNGRINAINTDGSIACGWMESDFGHWQPTVWRNGVRFDLTPSEAFTYAQRLTPDGSRVVGNSLNPSTLNIETTIWTWNGVSYDELVIGSLAGTPQGVGALGVPWGISDDGTIVVGQNNYSFNPGGASDGFIWTAATGMVKADDFVASLGIDIADEIQIRSIDGISGDGSTIIANGIHPTTFALRSVKVRIVPDDPTNLCSADFDGNGSVNLGDFGVFGAAFGSSVGDMNYNADADFDGNGSVNLGDFGVFGSQFGNGPEICTP